MASPRNTGVGIQALGRPFTPAEMRSNGLRSIRAGLQMIRWGLRDVARGARQKPAGLTAARLR